MAGKKISSGVHVSWPKPNFAHTVKTHKNFKTNFQGAMLYAHYEMTANELMKEIIKYLKSLDPKHPFLARLKDKEENRFVTIGKYMYILNHGGDIPEDIFAKLMPALEKVINEEEAKEAAANEEAAYVIKKKDDTSADANQVPKVVISVQDRLREKARETAGEVEGWLDEFILNKKTTVRSTEDFVNLFKANDLKSPHMRHILTIFEKRAEEIESALDGSDKYLVEAYSNFTKPELKKLDQFHKNLVSACGMFQEVAKVVRAPRKKKPVSHDKLVAKLKYKKEDNTLGIVSLNPVHIIGSKEVWVYNTKTRKLAQYKALDANGLSVKGASLVNFSADSAEKTLRKPAESLAEFKKATKVKLRTFLKELTTVDVPAGGKINEHHVILRIDK